MSTDNRKIGGYSLYFLNRKAFNENPDGEHEHIVDEKKLDDLFRSILALKQSDRTENIKSLKKMYYLDYYGVDKSSSNYLCNVRFVSAKYNHSPDWISLQGTKRKSNKSMDEGEEEKTHLSIIKTDHEFYVVLEERQHGLRMSTIIKYLNKYLKICSKMEDKEHLFALDWEIIPSASFIESLHSLQRIDLGTMYVDKDKLGSDFRYFSGRDADPVRKEVQIIFKPNVKDSIPQSLVKLIHKDKMDGKINRIRISGRNEDNNKMIIDTEKAKLVDFVTAELDPDGTVNSQSIFKALKDVLLEE